MPHHRSPLTLIGAFALLAAQGCHERSKPSPVPALDAAKPARTRKVSVNVNGQVHALELAGRAANARFLAGGTTLVDLLRLDVENPELLVDLGGLGYGTIEVEPNGVRIGALVRNPSDMCVALLLLDGDSRHALG